MAASREALIERHLPLADTLATRYRYTSEPLDDLVQVARLGLVKAVDRWDPDRGLAFSTFAVPTIMGELRRYFRDRTWAVRPPRRLQELYLRSHQARERLRQELGREPTARDLAARLGCTLEDVLEVLRLADAREARSLDAPLLNDPSQPSLGDVAVADSRDELDQTEAAVMLEQLACDLSARDREVLRLRFVEDLVQREIAERVGCSQMQVSRIIAASIRRLQAVATCR